MIGRKKKSKGNKLTSSGAFILSEQSPFAVKEAYKALRTNVAFSLPGGGAKCIGFTSAERAEGKSTNAINLGISFSEIGKRVVLLDCDMRLPTVASKLKLQQNPGLSDLLVGEATAKDVIRHYADNMDVIPSGQIPPDPTGLLSSDLMSKLIIKLKEVYDYVLIDLPPVTTVTDASILSRCIDGFLLVVRHEATQYKDVTEMFRLLELSEAKILGFIYNDAPVESKKYYSHYYAYGK